MEADATHLASRRPRSASAVSSSREIEKQLSVLSVVSENKQTDGQLTLAGRIRAIFKKQRIGGIIRIEKMLRGVEFWGRISI